MSYKRGDINLDGSVDVSDFTLWNENKFTSSLLWARGDINGDGSVGVSDFNRWNASKFTSSDGPSAVPEPAAGTLVLVAAALWGVSQRRRQI
jgi:MYXO-CTERM domain-containing protein